MRFCLSPVILTFALVGCHPDKADHGGGGYYWDPNASHCVGCDNWLFIFRNQKESLLTYQCEGANRDREEGFFNTTRPTFKSAFHGILNWIKPDDEAACKELEVGETRAVEWSSGDYERGTPVSSAYRVERVGAADYVVTVPIFFQAACASAELESKHIPQAWVTRIQGCYDEAAPYLRGPGGVKLKLKLERVVAPYVQAYHAIKMYPYAADIRENSGLLSPTSSCATIMHETFHWLGLVDEYPIAGGTDHIKDPISGETYASPVACRSPGPPNSLMRDQSSAWLIVRGAEGRSMIYPAHLNAVIYPRCPRRNANYYRCARFAYTSSCSEGEVPAVCRDVGWVD